MAEDPQEPELPARLKFVDVPFQRASDVEPKFRNKIIVTTVFMLKPGSTSKYDEKNHILLKRFSSNVWSEERASYFAAEVRKIYHHMLLDYYDTSRTDYMNSTLFRRSMKQSDDWIEEPLDKQVFVKYNYDESVGCEHYIRGCQMKCKTCGKFFPCRLCHDDVCDHEFPRYETEEVKCNYCGNEQPFSQYCTKCGKCFGSYFCNKCRLICDMGPDAKPNYHCDGCKMCMVGIREYSKHCYKCGGCYNIDYFDKHKCIRDRSECIVCLGDMVKTIYGRITLNCGHQMHIHCYQELLDKGIYKCPVCKKFLPTDSDREWIVKG